MVYNLYAKREGVVCQKKKAKKEPQGLDSNEATGDEDVVGVESRFEAGSRRDVRGARSAH